MTTFSRLAAGIVVIGLVMATVWLSSSNDSGETRGSTQGLVRPAASPAESPAARHERDRGRAPSNPDAPALSEERPPQTITRSSERPLSAHAIACRAEFHHSIDEAVAAALRPDAQAENAFALFRDIYWGWELDGLCSVLAKASARCEANGDSRRAAFLIGLAQAEFQIDAPERAADRLVDAVLAMQTDWVPDRHGQPRLGFFAMGPNVLPWSASDTETFRKEAPSSWEGFWGSRHRNWGIGSALVWPETTKHHESLFEWLSRLAADDTRPEPAMAATIWLHALAAYFVPAEMLPHGLPAAALHANEEGDMRFVVDTPGEWARVFRERYARAAVAGASWAAELKEVERRVEAAQQERRRLFEATKDRFHHVPDAITIWSLSDEFARRFSKVDTPRADGLRKLAARLVEFEPEAASVSEPPK